MSNHKELKVWQLAMDLVVDIYKLTKDFPDDEKFGLVSQMRRASVSIPSNIAEGTGRNSNGFFLNYAKGSACELETQLLIAQKLGYIPEKKEKALTQNIIQIQKMIYKLIISLN